MKKPALNNHPINNLARERWSPRAFSDRPVEAQHVASILEAARWAPSAMNEQPWRFMVGRKGDPTWDKILETLVEGNKVWAVQAPMLMLVLGQKKYIRNKRENDWYAYDTGQAVAHLSIEATNQGLLMHQMGGFDKEKARILFEIPEGSEPLAVIALGYYGDINSLPEDLQQRERAPRQRKILDELAFAEKFGEKYAL